jgi:sugar lactone lactonase YvrE
MLFDSDVGFVYRWSRDDGWSKVPGTDAPFPNGIELSPDGQSIYVNIYLGDEVRHIDLNSGELLGRVDVAQPDNITWSSDGRVLLVASHVGSLSDSTACMELEEGNCGMPFEIVALDPKTLERRTLLANAGPPMGAATVAVQVGPDLWLGTFAGDRMTRVVGGASSLEP